MKRIFGIGLLTAAFLVTLCACGKSDGTANQSAAVPDASASVSANTGPEELATLYLVADGKEQGQYELGYSGTLTGAQLLKGLTDLTGYHFDGAVTVDGKTATVQWADTATFIPETGTPAESVDLKLEDFDDFDSKLQFMLDSTYTTLTKNLEVTDVYFTTANGGALDYTQQSKWKLPADQTYGAFQDYYAKDTDGSSKASTTQKDFVYVDRRTNPGDAGDNITPEDAAQAVYDALVTKYEGDVDTTSDWVIALDEITTVKGSEGYSFSVGQGSEEKSTVYFHAVVTYDRSIYLMKDGASDYTLYGTIPEG